jgi:hypothetical protein
VSRVLSDNDSRYAIVDVNPFFNDSSSEVLLLIQSRDEVFEYSLKFPRHKAVRAILAEPTRPPAMVFPHKKGLAVLVDFVGPAKGAYLLKMPLRTSTALDLVPVASGEFEEITAEFRSVGQERTTRDQFCKSTNDFIAFYEKYSGSCDGKGRGIDDIEGNFARFWVQH